MSGQINPITLLGLKPFKGQQPENFLSCVLKTPDRHVDWIIGTPFICTKEVAGLLDEEEYKALVSVATIFSPKAGQGRRVSPIHTGSIHLKKEKSIVEMLKIIEVDELRIDAVEKLDSFVKNERPVSLILPDTKEGRGRGHKFIQFLSHKLYPETYSFFHQIGCGDREGIKADDESSEMVCALTIMDMRRALPIFDSRKANGLAVVFEHLNKKALYEADEKIIYDELHLIFCHDKENVIMVDGRAINMVRQLSQEEINAYRFLFTRPFLFPKKSSGKKTHEGKGKPEKKQEESKYIKVDAATYYNMTYTSTSTTWGNS